MREINRNGNIAHVNKHILCDCENAGEYLRIRFKWRLIGRQAHHIAKADAQ